MKLKGKVLLPVLSLITIGFILILYIVYTISANTVETEIFSGMERNANNTARVINQWLLARGTDLKTWSHQLAFTKYINETTQTNADELTHFMKVLNKDYPYYDVIFLTDKNGNAVVASQPQMAGKNISQRDYFTKARDEQKMTVSNAVVSVYSKGKIFVIAEPIYVDNKFKGVIAGAVKLDDLDTFFTKPIKLGKSGYSYIMQSDGLLIAHPKQDFVMSLNINKFEFGRVMLKEKKGTYKYWWEEDGVYKGQAFCEIPETGWIVAVTVPLPELLAPLKAIMWVALIGGVIVLAIISAIIYYLINGIVKIVNVEINHLENISMGDISKDLPHDIKARKDEFGEMANSFQNMIDAQRAKVTLAESIADGDLEQKVTLSSGNDSLGKALQKMNRKLNEIISQISDAAVEVSTGSNEVADASQSLSQGATEQAASLEEISSSVAEIASQTRTNAENATEAKTLSISTRDEAERGSKDVSAMLNAMDDINESSRKIATIIKSIDDIAFQTNILALNAAVEAARAGVHGKGFAVVADEVRSLAGRSAKAASETAELIETALHNAENGQNVAQKTSDSFKRILESIVKFTDITGEIAIASNEQAQSVSQINVGLSQVDQVTQQNTAHAEETASVAEELASQAKLMSELLKYFRINSQNRIISSSTVKNVDKSAPARSGWKQLAGNEKASVSEEIISLEDKDFGRF